MKRFKAIGIVEILLLAAFVALITITTWRMYGQTALNALAMSGVKQNLIPQSFKPPSSLLDQLQSLLDEFAADPHNVAKRVETAGMIGQLIAQNNSDLTNDIIEALQRLTQIDGNDPNTADAKICLASPSTCTTLMTVTDFSWKADTPNTTYRDSDGEKPIYADFSYDVTYIDNNGNIQTITITQDVKVQKEVLTAYINKGYTMGQALDLYMPTKYSDDNFTGSATSVQTNINNYISGKNNQLSTSESDTMCFSQLDTCG